MLKHSNYLAERPLSYGAVAVYPSSSSLKSRLIFDTKYDGPVNLYREVGSKLHVPRALCLYQPDKKIDKRSTGRPIKIAVNCSYGPRNPEQQRVLDESYALLKADQSFITKASTGFGKTWLGATLAGKLGLKTLVVVQKEDLMGEDQWRGAFKRFCGLDNADIGIIQQKKVQVSDRKVVFAMVQTLAKERLPTWVYDEFGFVIFDEVHHMAAETFQLACGMFNSKLRLGLSAGTSQDGTLRNDGKDFIFEAHLGQVRVQSEYIPVPPKVLVVDTKYQLPVVNRKVNGSWARIPLPHEPGKIMHVVVDMAKSYERNTLLVQLVKAAWEKERRVLVLSDLARETHLDMLHAMARVMGIPVKDMGFYVGGMSEADLKTSKARRVVWATYGMVAEGTDVPEWDTCILATPRANVKQPIGRVLREHPGKKQPVIIDVLDPCSKVLQRYFMKRCELYQSKEISGQVIRAYV